MPDTQMLVQLSIKAEVSSVIMFRALHSHALVLVCWSRGTNIFGVYTMRQYRGLNN